MTLLRPKDFFLTIGLDTLGVVVKIVEVRLLMYFIRSLFDPGSPGLVKKLHAWMPFLPQGEHVSVFLLAVLILAVIIAASALHYVASLSILGQAKLATVNIRKQVFDRYMSYGKSFYDTQGASRLNVVLTKFTDFAANQLRAFHNLYRGFATLSVFVVFMAVLSWKMALVVLIVFPLLMKLNTRVSRDIRESIKDHAKQQIRLDDQVFDILTCIPLIKTSGMGHKESERFMAVNDEESEIALKKLGRVLLISPIQETAMFFALILIALTMTALGYQGFGFQDLSACVIFFLLVRMSSPQWNLIMQARIALAQLVERFDRVREILENEATHKMYEGALECPALCRGVRIRGLSFAYTREREVLSDLSLEIPRGKKLLFVGPSGSGKSTLVHLLTRLYDAPAGTLFWDDTDLREFKIESLMQRIAFASQYAYLVGESLRENLTYGISRPVPKEEIVTLLRDLKLDRFAKTFDSGGDAPIGKHGSRLSGGEKQRVSIARALLKEADLYIFDEPINAVDPKTAEAVIAQIRDRLAAKTVLIISHRQTAGMACDTLVQFQKGSVLCRLSGEPAKADRQGGLPV